MKPSSALLARLAGLDALDDDIRQVAEGLVSDKLGRPLWEGEHTATLTVRPVPVAAGPATFDPVTGSAVFDGDPIGGQRFGAVVFPPATPIISVTGGTVRDRVSAWWPGAPGERVNVTYVGGWSSDTAPTVLLAVAELCAVLGPEATADADSVPAELRTLLAVGANRVQVADQSVGFSGNATTIASRQRADRKAETDRILAGIAAYRWKLG